jgi:predicted nucleotidyltransferase
MRYHDIELDLAEIQIFCRKWEISELAVFGSILRDDFGPESDIDCLVVFSPAADWSLLDVIRAEQELSSILGRPVDLIEKQVVEQSENWIRRRRILGTARTLYAG